MIILNFTAEILDTNNYLVIDETSKEAVLIDCSCDMDEVSVELDKYGANLKYILLTHAHLDHIASCTQAKEVFPKAKILLSESDNIFMEGFDVQCNFFGVPVGKNPVADGFIDESSEIFIGNKRIRVLETSGHTKGSICFLIENKLFSGDTLFFEEIGRCDLPSGNFSEIEKSIKEKLFKLNDDIEVYAGHGKGTTIAHEKKYNVYFGKERR